MAETSSTTVCNSKLHLNRAAQAKKKNSPSNKLWSMERIALGDCGEIRDRYSRNGSCIFKMPDDDLVSCVVACITEDVDITGVL
jgi:hypothetical protein